MLTSYEAFFFFFWTSQQEASGGFKRCHSLQESAGWMEVCCWVSKHMYNLQGSGKDYNLRSYVLVGGQRRDGAGNVA